MAAKKRKETVQKVTTQSVYEKILKNHGVQAGTVAFGKQSTPTSKTESLYNDILETAQKREREKAQKQTARKRLYMDQYNNLVNTVNGGKFDASRVENEANKLIGLHKDFFSDDSGKDMLSGLEEIKKTARRYTTSSGILPEEADAMRKEREAWQAQLDAINLDELDQKLDAITRNRAPDDYKRDPEYQKIMGMFQEEEELKGKIADADAKMDLYDRTDGFRESRIAPLENQKGFSTARSDYAANAAQREEAQKKQREQDTRRLQQVQQEIDSYIYNKEPYSYQNDPQFQALLDKADELEKTVRADNTDELGEYLSWYEALDADTKQKLLDGNLNSQAPKNRQLVRSAPGTLGKHWERMTEDEINAYYYIANTEGQEAAKEFLDDLQITLDQRHTTGREQATAEQMAQSPTWANALRGVATVGGNVVAGPIAFASDAMRTAKGEDFNPYSNAHYLQNIIGVTRSEAANDIQQTIAGDGESTFWNGVGEVAANAYQAALSSMDSIAGMYTLGNAHTISMGMGAASSRMRELYESGATDAEIYRGAIGSGFVEAFFEKFSLDALAENFAKANPEKWVKKLIAQAGVEGSEEFFTEIANLVIDSINRGMNSDHNQRVRELMGNAENPMGREAAEHQAVKEDAMNVFWAFLGGVMSGGMSAVGGAAMDSSRQNMIGQDILSRNAQEQTIAEAQELRQGDTLAQDLESKQEEGTLGKNEGILGGIKDSRDATRLGRLLEQNVADMTSRDRNAVQTAIERRLKESGTRVLNPEGTAEALTKSLAGEDLGVYDRFLLASNEKVADKVRNEIYSTADGTTAENAWVNRIETYSHVTGTKLRETNVEKAGREAMETVVKEEFGPYAEQVMELYAMNRGGQNRADYVAEAKQMYQAGMDGVALDKAPETSTLTDWQREIIWDMGQGKSDYEYDNNQGFATIKGETTPVNIVGVESAGDGKLTLRTDEGEMVDAKDVTFGSYSQSKLYSVISAMGVDTKTANEIVTMSQETGLDLNSFSRAMQDAFFAGRNGIPLADIPKDRYAMKLTQEQRKVAWQAGRAAARERAIQKGKRVRQGKHGRAKGGVKLEASARNIQNLNEQQKAGMNAANVLGAMGLDITVYASTEEQRAKGMENGNIRLSDGSIRIDLNAGDGGEGVMAWALSHEFTHFVEEMSPEKFQTFQEVLFEELGQNGQDVTALIEEKAALLKQQKAYQELSEERLMDIATSEVVAEMLEPMLTDTDAIARISDNLRQQDKGLWEKIKDWLQGLVEKLKNAYKDLTPGSAIAQQTRSIVTQSEEILNAWVDVATDAVVNYNLQDGQKNNTPDGVKFSLRGKTQQQITANYQAEVDSILNMQDTTARQLIVGYTPSLYESIGMPSLPLTIGSGHVYSAAKTEAEAKQDGNFHRGVHYHGLGDTAIKDIYSKIQDPVMIIAAKDVNKNANPLRSTHSVVTIMDVGTAGKSLLVPVEITAERNVNGVQMDVNTISSVYEKSVQNLVAEAIAMENTGEVGIFYAKKEALTLPVAGVQFPVQLQQSIASGKIVHHLSEKVNMNISEATQSRQFKRWFGDWQNDPANASKVVNGDGTPKVVYHQTGGLFTVFDTRREGAGSRDEGTPFGIFLKSSDRDIGLSGKFQMGLYADIKNPLRANNRDDLRYKIMQMSDEYETLIAEHNRIDSEYKAKADNAIKELREFMLEWRKENPNASRTALYDVPRFNELFEAEDTITDEWTAKIAEVSSKAKEAMTEALEKNGYDGVFLAEDAGSFGRSTDAFIALRPEQVKSATNNLGTFDASNPDIRFSQRSAAQFSQREFNSMAKSFADEIERWDSEGRDQGQSFVLGSTGEVLQGLGAIESDIYMNGDKITTILQEHPEITLQEIKQIPQILNDPVLILKSRNVGRTGQNTRMTLFGSVKGTNGQPVMAVFDLRPTENHFVINDMQKVTSAYTKTTDAVRFVQSSYIMYADKKRATSLLRSIGFQMPIELLQSGFTGSITYRQRSVNLYGENFSDVFSEGTEILHSERGRMDDMESWELNQYLERGELEEQVRQLKGVQAEKNKEIKQLRKEKTTLTRENNAALRTVKEMRRVALESYRRQQSASDQRMRQLYEQQYRMVMDDYQRQLETMEGSEKTQARVEGWRKTEERGKLQRTLTTLNKMMLNPTKTAFVPDSLQPAVIKAMEAINNYRMPDEIDMGKIRELQNELNELILDGATKNKKRIRAIHKQLNQLQGDYGSPKDNLVELKRMYAELMDANEGKVAQVYDEGVEGFIADAMEAIGDTDYSDLSLKQLQALNDAYAAILHRVRTANNTFAYGQKEAIDQLAKTVAGDFRRLPDREKLSGENVGPLEKFAWNNLKPEYAFERLGSATMTTLYHNLRKGEDVFYQDVVDARGFALGAMARHGYQNWKDQTIEYESVDGKKFSLNLEERMSLYAYSRRRQAIEHLMKGGIRLTEDTKRIVKGIFGIKTEKVFRDYQNYRLSLETIQAIGDSLTQQQRAFAEEMQGYLSTVCADKNNEISRALYGVSKAKEKYYWPIETDEQFVERKRNQQQNPGNRQKNAGHMKATTQNANNPIVVSGFLETWGNHVNNTAMYHAFTLPMEDFLRVYNFNSTAGVTDESIVQLINLKHGKGATDYIDQFLKDLNQGVRADPRETIASSLTSKFKKGAVSASLSVAIQQPSAVGRAFAVIDHKYFRVTDWRYYATSLGDKKATKTQARWEEMKQNAPVVGIKEMGRFDVNMGRSTVDFITGAGETGFMATVDKISGYLPEKMDQATWMMIYNAAERQCKAQGYTGDALNAATGELFTEAITKTQVYDSVFSRSGNMRSKSLYMNMATSFMAEPTTTANMFMSAMADVKNKDYKAAKRKVGSIAAATVLNAILASFIYGARDDDEDKSYTEKYLKSLTSELVDSLNPMGYVPVVKDIWSLFQGYDVDRSDMTLWSEAVKALKRVVSAHVAMGELDEDDADYEKDLADARKKVAEAWVNAVGAVCNLFGLPVKNVLRDVKAILYTTPLTVKEDRGGDWTTAKNAMWEGVLENLPEILPTNDSKSEELYKAMTSGSQVWVSRMRESYSSDKAYESAVRGSLREKDKRIRQAAKALSNNADSGEYKRIVSQILSEGHFTREQVEKAIQAEARAIRGSLSGQSTQSIEKFIDLYEDNLLDAEQYTAFLEYRDAEGEDGKKIHHKDEMIVYIGSLKVNAKAKDTLYNLMGYPEKDLERMPWHNSGYSLWEARVDNPALADYSDSTVETFLEIRNSQITVQVFTSAYEYRNAKDGEGKQLHSPAEIMAYIDSLNLSRENKDELYLAMGYQESTLKKTPWN